MASLDALATEYEGARDSCILDHAVVVEFSVKATKFYAGWAALTDAGALSGIDSSTDVTEAEWSIIGPLFELYVEKEQAMQMEATQVMGITSFGRSAGEISGEIAAKEESIPRLAFCSKIITI